MTSANIQPQDLQAQIALHSAVEELIEPPEQMEWVDGQLIEKTNMTIRHAQIQSRLARYWGNYLFSSSQGGEVLTEAACRTQKQIRRPDVSYLTPELFEQFANATVVPQSFPLIAEIASPDDSGEELFLKAREYLESGGQEVWLVFPQSGWIIVLTLERHLIFTSGDTVETQMVLTGFEVAVDKLLASGNPTPQNSES